MRLIYDDDFLDALAGRAERIITPHEWEVLRSTIDSVPTAMQLWTSVKDALPTSDGIYFVVYKVFGLDDCVSTREFRGGKWREEVGCEEVRFWMPIHALPEGNA